MRSHEAMHRATAIVPSDSNGVTLCTGTFGAMPEDVCDAIRDFGRRGKIHHVHFRNVRGSRRYFEEVFIDEGDIDMRRAMETYRDNGFAGPFMMDHTPTFPAGDSERLGKAYANGYIRRLLQEVYG